MDKFSFSFHFVLNSFITDMGDLGSPQTPGAQLGTTSLMSEKDLVPTYTDLDRIFDTSGEEDNDDTVSNVL
jgi:hypothetical protein